MRPIPAALVLLAGLLLGFGLSAGCARALAQDSFDLGEHDKLIAEAPGCWAECRSVGARRVCTIKDRGCKAVCQSLPECKPDGMNMIRVCAVMRDTRI